MRRTKTKSLGILGQAGALVLALLAALWFLGALRNLDAGQSERGRAQLEETLRRAAVACYASDGAYPPTLEELCRRSGIRVDVGRYHVFYEVFADNLMPGITVLGARDER